jgi:hypothetical protein
MSEQKSVFEKIIALQNTLITQKRKDGSCPGLERLNKLLSNIKRIGFMENIQLDGTDGRYLIIDGISWQQVCKDLHVAPIASFVLWEERAFLGFLETHVIPSPRENTAFSPKTIKSSGKQQHKKQLQPRPFAGFVVNKEHV